MTTTTKQHQNVVVRRHSNSFSQKTLVHFELFFLRCDSKSQFNLMKRLIKSRKRSQREYSSRWHFQHERSFESLSQQRRSEAKSQDQKWSKEWLRRMKKTSKRWIKDIYKNSKKKKKQRSNVNRDVFVKSLIIHLIVHHNIVLYQNQQSLLFENLSRFIRVLMICDDFKIKNRIKSLSKKNLADLNKK